MKFPAEAHPVGDVIRHVGEGIGIVAGAILDLVIGLPMPIEALMKIWNGFPRKGR